MNTSLKKTLIEWVIAELLQFSVHLKKEAVYLRFIFNCFARRPMHIKINGEYIIKKTLIERLPFVILHIIFVIRRVFVYKYYFKL